MINLKPPSQPPSPEVVVCTPIYDRPSMPYLHSLMGLGAVPVLQEHGHITHVARARLTVQALGIGASHLLLIDDDMVFAPDALERLLSCNKPVVGGLYFSRYRPWNPLVYDLANEDPPIMKHRSEVPPIDTLLKCDGTGAGFLLVRREVFDTIEEAFGKGSWWIPIGLLAEDLSFCWRIRKCGYEVYVDTGTKIGHLGEVVIDGEVAAFLRSRP